MIIAVCINMTQALGLGIVSWITGSHALFAQTVDNVAELAVGLFLYIGVLSSGRPSDDSHPLGYGRERFFWSLFAAIGIFVGGGGLALNSALNSALHPSPLGSFITAYVVLAVTIVLDAVSLVFSLPPLRHEARERGLSSWAHLLRKSDPALTTVVLSGGCALIGGFVAAVGVAASQATGSSIPDTVASGLIGILLLVTSAFLLRTNRELLTGRGVQAKGLKDMRQIVAAQNGVLNVPDLFAVFVGPSSIIVSGDVTFADGLSVPEVEDSIERAAAALREKWPSVEFVYLTPVPKARPRRVKRPAHQSK